MNKRIFVVVAIGLFIFISMSSFKYDNSTKIILKPGMATQPGTTKDKDVVAYMKEMGLKFMIDDAAFNEMFPGVDLNIDTKKQVNLEFPNATASKYQLDIFDKYGSPVVTLVDIFSDEVAVDSEFFEEGTYIYKLTGAGNLYAGKFEYEAPMASVDSDEPKEKTKGKRKKGSDDTASL